jgi:hypothetical protein
MMNCAKKLAGVALVLMAGALGVGACGPSSSTDTGSTTAGSTSTEGAGSTGASMSPPEALFQGGIDKIDLLLAIDNSPSMGDKQQILAAAIPTLVNGLLNPACVDASTGVVGARPASPFDSCDTVNPPGFNRAFTAILDVHIGIVSSSLGGHGNNASTCGEEDASAHQNDAGHLLTRTLGPGGVMGEDDGWNGGGSAGEGFLLWDPSQPGSTPKYPGNGITSFGTPGSGDGGLEDQLTDLVLGTGQDGCGYESQLESWYRFLVDPHPYASIGPASMYDYEQHGLDTTVMTERADFLRSDSLLAIVMLTDENDCSVREYGAFPILTSPTPMVRPTAACATNPLDPCCGSCLNPPAGCGDLPECAGLPTLSAMEDQPNLRCFDTQRRFGVDFMYPIERYSTALTSTTLPDPHNTNPGDGTANDGIPSTTSVAVPNPLYNDLQVDSSKFPSATHQIRDPSRVLLAGIVGVPWQDIAVDPSDPTLAKGFKDSEAMTTGSPDAWDLILGNPAQRVKPLDPHMIESANPRQGTDPVDGVALAPPTAAPDADPINGHEWITNDADLEYACVYPLAAPKDCTVVDCGGDCPTSGPNFLDNPLCDATTPTSQTRGKGYPGIRELQLIQAVGDQGIVGSICPVSTSGDPTATSYGYNAAVQGIVDRLKRALAGGCFPAKLKPDPATGAVPCHIIEAIKSTSCDRSCVTVNGAHVGGRSPVSGDEQGTVAAIEQSPEAAAEGWNCFCEIDQLSDASPTGQKTDALHDCLTDPADSFTDDLGEQVAGFCYVDPHAESGANAQLVQSCPAEEKRVLRFIGDGNPVSGATAFITCSGN